MIPAMADILKKHIEDEIKMFLCLRQSLAVWLKIIHDPPNLAPRKTELKARVPRPEKKKSFFFLMIGLTSDKTKIAEKDGEQKWFQQTTSC